MPYPCSVCTGDASFYCIQDQAYLCQLCNTGIHCANAVAARHRVLTIEEYFDEISQVPQLPADPFLAPGTPGSLPDVVGISGSSFGESPLLAESSSPEDFAPAGCGLHAAASVPAPVPMMAGLPQCSVPAMTAFGDPSFFVPTQMAWGVEPEMMQMPEHCWLSKMPQGCCDMAAYGSAQEFITSSSDVYRVPSAGSPSGNWDFTNTLHTDASSTRAPLGLSDLYDVPLLKVEGDHLSTLQLPGIQAVNSFESCFDSDDEDKQHDAIADWMPTYNDNQQHGNTQQCVVKSEWACDTNDVVAVETLLQRVPSQSTCEDGAVAASFRRLVPIVSVTPEQATINRADCLARYREKKKNRSFGKTIRYASRKFYAEAKPRIQGRFATREEVLAMKAAAAAAAAEAGTGTCS